MGNMLYSVNGKKIMIVWQSLQLGNWKVAAIIPESALVLNIGRITLVTIIFSILAIGFAVMLSILTIRLARLLEAEQNRKQDIRILHEQIKPHFLYNALGSIEKLGEIGEYEKMIRSIKALTEFYRLGFSKGRQLISLKNEIAHAESYIKIQMVQLNSKQSQKLSYKIQADNEFMDFKIPKISLQPILENAITHGIKHGEELHISITVVVIDDYLKIEISDDGIGIPDDKIEKLCYAFKTDDWSELPDVFGIRNVHERIRLHFGVPYGLSITSIFEQGTVVNILLPSHTHHHHV